MPKYYPNKICGYYLYYTSFCIIECMHVHASDSRLTESFSAKLFARMNTIVEIIFRTPNVICTVCHVPYFWGNNVEQGILFVVYTNRDDFDDIP